MRTETEEIRDNLKYLSLLARDYPSQAAAASEIISTQALLKLPKGTEHFMSDLHGENEAFVHILNSASGVIREKVDIVLGDTGAGGDAGRAGDSDLLSERERCPSSRSAAPTRKRWNSGTVRRCCGSSTSAASSLPSTPGSMSGPACRPAAVTFWMSCSMPTSRTTTKTSTTARSSAASSRMAAPISSSSVSASSSSGWPWTSSTSWATCSTAAPAPTSSLIC